jgi:ABC-type sugar transport system ATPase subunit
MTDDWLLDCHDVHKAYGGIRALRGASLRVGRGTVHGLVGHNGAGKSTLTKVVAGLVVPDAATVTFDGDDAPLGGRRDAIARGILAVPQELTVLPGLSVAENICVGAEPHRGPWLSWPRMREHATRTLELLGAELPLRAPVEDLMPSQQRIVMIAMALARPCKLLILDEPTASLGREEAQPLLALVERLPQRGLTLLYISHRLDEVVRICDRVSVMRDGLVTETLAREQTGVADLVQRMVGDAAIEAPAARRRPGTAAVRLEGVSAGLLHDVTVEAAESTITGVTGLVGSGAEDLLHVFAGVLRPAAGRIDVGGVERTFGSPADALAAGIGYVAGSRAAAGLRDLTVRENVLASSHRGRTWLGLTTRRAERERAAPFVESLGLGGRLEDELGILSGGNQQKAIVARLLAAEVRILVLNDPTAGVDVSARAELHRLIRAVANEGHAVIVRASEPEELVDLADVIHVFAGGRIARTFTGDEISLAGVVEASSSSGHAA